MWRSGYDMSPMKPRPTASGDQVKPLYEQLHCYARPPDAEYGTGQGEVAGGMLPAPHGQPVAAGLGQPLGHAAALPGRRQLDVNGALNAIAQADLASAGRATGGGDGSAAQRAFMVERAAASTPPRR